MRWPWDQQCYLNNIFYLQNAQTQCWQLTQPSAKSSSLCNKPVNVEILWCPFFINSSKAYVTFIKISMFMARIKFISRESFCCSNKARKLHLFSAKVAFMRCKLHLCAHLTVKHLKQPILHAKIEKVAKSNMQKSKKLHANIEKVAKSCMQKSKKLQKVAI